MSVNTNTDILNTFLWMNILRLKYIWYIKVEKEGSSSLSASIFLCLNSLVGFQALTSRSFVMYMNMRTHANVTQPSSSAPHDSLQFLNKKQRKISQIYRMCTWGYVCICVCASTCASMCVCVYVLNGVQQSLRRLGPGTWHLKLHFCGPFAAALQIPATWVSNADVAQET